MYDTSIRMKKKEHFIENLRQDDVSYGKVYFYDKRDNLHRVIYIERY